MSEPLPKAHPPGACARAGMGSPRVADWREKRLFRVGGERWAGQKGGVMWFTVAFSEGRRWRCSMQKDPRFSRTDLAFAILLAVLLVAWLVAYGVLLIKYGVRGGA